MNTPKISVLMPVYNGSRFLREAIDSILHQTFRDFEFLVIDDGSSDDSEAIVGSYNDPRIVFFKNSQNLGISATLNKGISFAKTDLIARMDADDISHVDRLQKQYNYMLQHPRCALLSTWANVMTEDKKLVRLERYPSAFYYYNLTFECWIYHPTIMFRKKQVQEVGMYSMPFSEDFDLFWKISRKFEIGNVAEPLLDYRLSSTSLNLVQRKTEYDIANEENVKRNIEYYLGKNACISKPIFECLRHNFLPILATNNIEEIRECLKVLNDITGKIINDPNPNRNEEAIRLAHFHKRRFILNELSKLLPKHKMFELMARTGEWSPLSSLVIKGVRWRVRKVIKSFSF